MRKPDEAAGMRLLRFAHAVVDLPADREIGLIEARAAGKHAGIDAGGIHHADMRVQIGEQRIEQIIRIAIAIEVDRDLARIALEQFRRRVVLLEVDEHGGPYDVIPGPSEARNPESISTIRDYGFRTFCCAGIRNDAARHMMANSVLRRSVTSMAPG